MREKKLFSMEICTMDKSMSHFYKGIVGPNNNNNNNNNNTNFNNYEATIGGSGSSDDDNNYVTPYAANENVQYQENFSEREWKIEDVECKQEIDSYLDNPNINNNLSYGGPSDNNNYNESFHYGYNNTNNNNSNSDINSPYYTNDPSTSSSSAHRHHSQYRNSGSSSSSSNTYSPYQMSTSAKSQLPAWYNPPQPSSILPPPSPSIHHQHHHHRAHSAYYPTTTNFFPHHPYQAANYMASTSSDHNMRNMIQMTNRNGREARNRAEKHRRDKLNGSIQELSSMVPHVAESPRRVDKTAVLRFSAHGLRIDYVFGQQQPKNNRYLINPKSTEGLMKLLDTFLLTVTCRGNIVLVSSSVEQYLGHCRSDLYGQSLLNITHPEDHAFLKQQLIPTDLHNLFAAKTDENGEIRSRTKEEEEEIDLKLREDRRDFTIRLARAGPRSEPTQYELVRIDGCFKRAESAPRGKPNSGPTGLQLIRRARGRDDNIPLHSISGNDIILIAMARVMKPPMFCDRLIEACRYEYKTRHLVDGRIVQCDQRISIVAGYMTEEVSGLSPFTFMHRDDVRWVMVALRQMYDFGSPVGESCYRLMSRTGQFIYLKTRGILEIDERTRQVHSFICINTLVSDDEGRRLIKDMKRKFSAIISEAELSALESDVPAVENPQLLERAILNLITNLNNQAYDDDDDVKSIVSDSTIDDNKGKQPLAIIAPNTVSVKPTISRAVDVITKASGKNVQVKDEPKSPENTTPNFQTQSSNESSPVTQFNIKIEPGSSSNNNNNGNLLSPTSSFSVSSHDSDICSPPSLHGTVSNQGEMISSSSSSSTSSSRRLNESGCRSDDFYGGSATATKTTYHYGDVDSIRNSSSDSFNSNYGGVASSSAISSVNSNNNNSVNINRNSVLKRTHTDDENDRDDDDDYREMMVKKRVLSNDLNRVPQNQIDLLASTASDISEVLSSTFPDDSLTEQFPYGDMAVTPQSHNDEFTTEQEEQREILKSLRESCSVIQQTSKSQQDSSSNS